VSSLSPVQFTGLFQEPDLAPVEHAEEMPKFAEHTPHGRDQKKAWLRKQRKERLEKERLAKAAGA
jgi:hypothetical protein